MGKIGDIRGTALEELAEKRVKDIKEGKSKTLEEIRAELVKETTDASSEPKK